MTRLINLTGGMLAALLLVVAGCSPAGSGSASLVVPEGMEAATFSVSGML